MAYSIKYHVMKVRGRTCGHTKGSEPYAYEVGDIIEAPATEFAHLRDQDVDTFDEGEEAQEARKSILND